MVYHPIKITNFKEGLIQEREEFTLPNDAFTELRNAYVWRGGIIKKRGANELGRLRRSFTNENIPGGAVASPWTFNIFGTFSLAGNSPDIELGSVFIAIGAITFSDNGDGTFSSNTALNGGAINYSTGKVTLIHTALVGAATTITYSYFPCFPVMGLKTREKSGVNVEDTVAFDTNFSYILGGTTWTEFPSATPTTWSGSDFDFFWTTNFWTSSTNVKLFWVTNFVNAIGNDMRFHDGITWNSFAPVISGTTKLLQARILLPFRGRLIALNTIEGIALGGSAKAYRQRIRWPAIGNPTLGDSYKETIRGKGSFLDIPTSETIISAGFVRDNLVIFCESSTWQLRYTGNTIQPFQIERVNSELGVESTFSGVQFDTSIVGIGDKGIVECDAFQSQRIDDKIIDFVININNLENGTKRVSGIRNFPKKLAYWAFPDQDSSKFPNKRLVFNYEDQSWAIFDDFITALGVAQPSIGTTWEEDVTWEEANFNWRQVTSIVPQVIGGNQRGFVFILDSKTTNDASLTISEIKGNNTTPTTITSVNHGFQSGTIIEITGVVSPLEFETTLNDNRFLVSLVDADKFNIFKYNAETRAFNLPQADPSTWRYLGGGRISVVDNFVVKTKKFNFLDEGKRIKIGFVDVLMSTTADGEITMEMLGDYSPNILNKETGDTFFNTTIPTTAVDVSDGSAKTMQRVFCNTRGTFLSIVFTLSNTQMNDSAASSNIRFDGLIIWARPAEKDLYTGAI